MVVKRLGHIVPFKHTCYDYCTPIILILLLLWSPLCQNVKNPVWLGTNMFIYHRTSLAINLYRIEPNVSTTIQSSSSVAIQNRADVRLSTLWRGEMVGNQWEWQLCDGIDKITQNEWEWEWEGKRDQLPINYNNYLTCYTPIHDFISGILVGWGYWMIQWCTRPNFQKQL